MSGKSSIPRPIPADIPASLRTFMVAMKHNAARVRARQTHSAEIVARRYTAAALAQQKARGEVVAR